MSLSITPSTPAIPYLAPTASTTQPTDEPTATLLAKLDDREQRASSHVEKAAEKATTQLDKLAQYAVDHDYSRLADAAGKATAAVNAAEQRLSQQITQHYDTAEQLVVNRPADGYSISQETADKLTSKIDQGAETRLAALTENSARKIDHLAELQQQATANGFTGERLDAVSERIESRVEHRSNLIEQHADRALTMIQNRINDSYEIPPDPGGLSTDAGNVRTDVLA